MPEKVRTVIFLDDRETLQEPALWANYSIRNSGMMGPPHNPGLLNTRVSLLGAKLDLVTKKTSPSMKVRMLILEKI